MCRQAGVAIVFADSDDYPCIPDVTGEIVYARLQRSREEEPNGYDPASLDRWSETAKAWARGESPGGYAYTTEPPPPQPRHTFVFFISGAKVRNPLAAKALIERL